MKRRCTEGSTSPQYQRRHFSVSGATGPIESEEFFAFGDPHCLRFVCQCQGFFFVNLDFVRDDVFRLRDVFGSQELLGTGAARSTLAVVVPLDLDGHDFPLGGSPVYGALLGLGTLDIACWIRLDIHDGNKNHPQRIGIPGLQGPTCGLVGENVTSFGEGLAVTMGHEPRKPVHRPVNDFLRGQHHEPQMGRSCCLPETRSRYTDDAGLLH